MAYGQDVTADRPHDQDKNYNIRVLLPSAVPENASLVDVVVVRSFHRPDAISQPSDTINELNEKATVVEHSVKRSSPKNGESPERYLAPPPSDVSKGRRPPNIDRQHSETYKILTKVISSDWRKNRSLDVDMLMNNLENVRIVLFEYAEQSVLKDSLIECSSRIADRLNVCLARHRIDRSDRPIVFLGDNVGVVTIQRYLMKCAQNKQSRKEIVWATISIVLLHIPSGQVEKPDLYFQTRDKWLKPPNDSAERLTLFRKLATVVQGKPDDRYETLRTLMETSQSISPVQARRWHRMYQNPHTRTPGSKHGVDFENMYKFHAEWCPAMLLIPIVWNGPRDHGKLINVIRMSLDTYRLLNTAHNGSGVELKRLLRQRDGPEIDLQDGMGRSALHLAVRGSHSEAIEVLGEKGDAAFFSIQDSTGKNALHYAAMYCLDYEKLNDIVAILVKGGVNIDALDDDRLSARKAAADRSVRPQLLPKNRPLKGPSLKPSPPSDPKPPDPVASEACRGFQATLAEFHSNVGGTEEIYIQQPSVFELLYEGEGGPERFFQTKQDQPSDGSNPSSSDLRFRWYHLPVNHIGWIADLFARMKVDTANDPPEYDQQDGETYWSRYMRPQARNHRYLQYFKKPDFHPISDNSDWSSCESGTKDFVLYIPYLNFEMEDTLVRLRRYTDMASSSQQEQASDKAPAEALEQQPFSSDGSKPPTAGTDIPDETDDTGPSSAPPTSASNVSGQDPADDHIGVWHEDKRKNKMRCKVPLNQPPNSPDVEQRLIRSYLMTESSKFHQRRTLDQAHYPMLKKTSHRDDDQVVLRRQRGKWLGETLHPLVTPKPHRLVMVDQLWIWVIGDTVVTSFPQKWTNDRSHRECDVLDWLLFYLQRPRRSCVTTAHDFADLIIKSCVSIFNKPIPRAQLQLQSLFQKTVGDVANDQMELFREFEAAMDPGSEKSKEKRSVDGMFSIEKDIKLLDEVRDLRDEINMILQILHDQAMAIRDMLAIIDQAETSQESGNRPDPSAWRREKRIDELFKKRHGVIDANIRDFERMRIHAETSYEEADSLLDLKQKQLNVLEARVARRGADVILVFTVATIVFGSLSFVTSFFTLNVRAFPHPQDVTLWNLGDVLGLVVAISLGLALLFIIFAFQFNRLRKGVEKLFQQVSFVWDGLRIFVEVWFLLFEFRVSGNNLMRYRRRARSHDHDHDFD